MDYNYELSLILTKMEKELKMDKLEKKRTPNGNLCITNYGGWLRVYREWSSDGKRYRHNISDDPPAIATMARKKYLSIRIKKLEDNVRLLSAMINKLSPLNEIEIYKQFPKHYNLIASDVIRANAKKEVNPIYDEYFPANAVSLNLPENKIDGWGEAKYRANSYERQNLNILTRSGIYVRSKSESTILEIYNDLNIPVHYDELISFGGVRKAPDFVSLRRDGKLIYHEHMGLVKDVQYMAKNKEKIALYERFGIVPWDNLIITYDKPDGGFDARLAEAQIRSKHLL